MSCRPAVAALVLVASCGSPRESPRTETPAEPVWTDPAPHQEGFVVVAGARLYYLDWGGTGPNLILIHGLGDNPHVFDDLVPALGGGFRVVAYGRRGHSRSSKDGPFDTPTLTADLLSLMDSLGIAKAHLAGWSMGGNEVTAMAGAHPDRVGRVVYLDAGYDWADPAFAAAVTEMPADVNPAPEARASLAAFRSWERSAWLTGVADGNRVEAYIRDLVAVGPGGAVSPVMSDSLQNVIFAALLANRRDYGAVRVPALAIYATTFFDTVFGDSTGRARAEAWEAKHVRAFRAASIARIKRELRGVETITVPGSHMNFIFVSRDQVADAMTRFLRAER